MTSEDRLKKAQEKIAKRKTDLEIHGIPESSVLADTVVDFFSPAIMSVIGLAYPDAVLLGETKPKTIKRLAGDHPIIWAPAHRGTFDIARILAHAVPPRARYIIGDERVFYCTTNEILLKLIRALCVDRDDPKDRSLLIDRASKVALSGSLLEKHHDLIINPEGAPNVCGSGNLPLYPGVIKIALNVGGVIPPIGNEIHVNWNKEGTKIVGDINYMMYEDYNEMGLYRPSDDIGLAQMHRELSKTSYLEAAKDTYMERFIQGNHFRICDIDFSLEERLYEFLNTHPVVRDFVECLKGIEGINTEPIMEYLKRCVVIKDLNSRQIECLDVLDRRMRALSDKINAEIDIRHPRTEEQRKKDSEGYPKFYIENVQKVGKKGPTTLEVEVDHFINHATPESIILSETIKVLEGLYVLLEYYKNTQAEQLYHSYHGYVKELKESQVA